VRGPGQLELRARDFGLAGEGLDGEAVEARRLERVLRVARRDPGGGDGALRPIASREGAEHLRERRARLGPLPRARVVLREIVERLGARLPCRGGDGVERRDRLRRASRVEGRRAASQAGLRRGRRDVAPEGVFVSGDGLGVTLRLEEAVGARRGFFGAGGRGR
jgi:hypothetical protein